MILAFLVTAVLASITVQLPHDVEAFLDRRAQCEHWAGEEPYDGPRAGEIAVAVERLRCDSLETDESRIRLRYKRYQLVIKALEPEQP
ncbi:hypothetical protein DSM25558_5408 [Agrobacterium sp. DSM 25558]|nr:hypothetical protein DSM25558_5408 [Agrobacterium sp. DSM 25558]